MERLKKIVRAGIMLFTIGLMVSVFSLRADAATITYSLSDISYGTASTTVTVKDNVAYSVILTPSNGFRLPKAEELHIYTDNDVVLQDGKDYTYSPSTGNLNIHAASVHGNISIVGTAFKLTAIEQPSIKGNFVVYETLHASVLPAGAGDSASYQWYRDGVAINDGGSNNGTGSSYTLQIKDIGKTINVRVTGGGDYYEQKISNNTEVVSKLTQLPPAPSTSSAVGDVIVRHVTKNGGDDGEIKSNLSGSDTRVLEYYDKKSAKWKNLPVVGLEAGEYQVRFKETTDSKSSDSITVQVLEPCTSPVITDVTITHLATAGASTGKMTANTQKDLEFYNGTAWVPFPVSDLKAGRYEVRFAKTSGYLASAAAIFCVKEPTSLVMTQADIELIHVSVKGAATGGMKSAASNRALMEVYVDSLWKTLPVTTLKAGSYQVRYSGTETTFPSNSCTVKIKEPADEPKDIKVTDVAVYGENTGVISGLKTTWEMSRDEKTWTPLTETTLKGLSAGTYYFRTKETPDNLPSASVEKIVKQPERTPEATIDFVNGTLKNLVPKAEYIIENVAYLASDAGTISILENSFDGKAIGISKKGNGTTTNNSAKQTLNIPARPKMPEAPVIKEYTDTSIEIVYVKGLEYSITKDNSTAKNVWVTPADGETYTFKNLTSNTPYTVHVRVKAVEGKSFCSSSGTTQRSTKKSSAFAVAPKTVEIVKITDTTITIEAVDGQEYRYGTNDFEKATGSTITWTKLTAGAQYIIETRTAATADTMYSRSLKKTIYTFTKQKLEVGQEDIDYYNEVIKGLAKGEYTINGGKAISVTAAGTLYVGDYYGRTIQLRMLGNETLKKVDSDPVEVHLKSSDAPTAEQANLGAVESTLTGFIIPKPDPLLEYQVLDTDGVPLTEWESSFGEKIVFDGLEHSTPYLFQVCFRRTETMPKSNAYISGEMYTKFYEETPNASYDTVTEKLTGLVPNATYRINGTSETANASGTISIADEWIDKQITIVKCGDNAKTVDSFAQEMTLPGRVTKDMSPVAHPVTYHNGTNGEISGISDELEYSADGGKTWHTVSEQAVKNLAVGEYQVRYKAEADKLFAGLPQIVSVTLNTAIADYKLQVIAQLEKTYEEMVASQRYNEKQINQLRALLDDGIDNINTAFDEQSEVDNASKTVLENMTQVPCANISTADGNLIGADVTSNESLQYPNDSDEIWGNVANTEGMDSALLFDIQILGKTDTAELRELFAQAVKEGTITSADGSLDAGALRTLLNNVELKLGMEITLSKNESPTNDFNGTYTVTILLPPELQGKDGLNIISIGAGDSVSYHAANVTGNYLSFETTHFSVYGIIGTDTLTILKDEVRQKVYNTRDELDKKQYSRENWDALHEFIDLILQKIDNAKTEQEVNDAWNELVNIINQTETKKSLGWLWILIPILVVLIAFIIVCYLVWQVRYFDGEEGIRGEFHFWRSKVVLLVWEKEGYVLEGWYHDPELTDRAENDFHMPWHTVKLFAKWNVIEILETLEEEPVIDPESMTEDPLDEPEELDDQELFDPEPLPDFGSEEDTSEDETEPVEEDAEDDELPEPEPLADGIWNELEGGESDEEEISEDALALLTESEEESPALLEAPEEETDEEFVEADGMEDDEQQSDADALPEASEDQPALLTSAENLSAQTEDADEASEENAALPEVAAEDAALLEAPAADAALLEAPAEDVALLEAPAEDTALLEAPAEDAALIEAPAEDAALLEAPVEDTALLDAPAEALALLEAPDEETALTVVTVEEEAAEKVEKPAVVLLGEIFDEESTSEQTGSSTDYKNSDSYRAWLQFGSEEEVPVDEPEVDKLEDGDEVQLFVNEKTGEKYPIRFNLSFRAKMTSLDDDMKGFYRELKDEFLTYQGVKARISWKAESVRKGRETVAKFMVRENTLCVFLALDPDAYRDSKYVFESVKDTKAHEAVPMMVRVKSDLSCRKVKELIADIMQTREVKRLDAAPETDYAYLDEDSSTEARLRAGQLRIRADGPDDQIRANREAAAILHYLISPEITAEEAEALISDEMLNALMPPAKEILIVPDLIGEVSIEQLCKKFYTGDVIDIEAMKEKGLLAPAMTYVKIIAEGDMTKKLTVSAHMFERTAAKMILLTGGDLDIINE